MSEPPCHPYLPPEWAPQSSVMLTWPHAHGDWAAGLKEVEAVFVELTRHIIQYEKTLIVCFDADHREQVRALLALENVDGPLIRMALAPSNDSWARDHGPLTVLRRNEPALLDFGFNGWGGKYPAKLDNTITRTLYRQNAFGDLPLETVNLILEGGSIEVDGAGTLMATERSLLSTTRNPGLEQARLEKRLGELLGINRFLWLHHGFIAGDDTDGHIDTLARLCDHQTIAYTVCDDPTDEHNTELKAMAEELRGFRSVTGEPYRLVPLSLPGAKFDTGGQRLPASYTNFVIINGAVLVPTYDDAADASVLNTLSDCFPDRAIIGVNALPLIRQYGSLHCVTMQFPAGVI